MENKIIDILLQELNTVYCDSCNEENCEDCNRKEMGWSISINKAKFIANKILN